MIDFIAVIIEMEQVSQIVVKTTGELKDKRLIVVSDDSDHQISATIWGDIVHKLDLQIGNIVSVKGARISDYQGKSLNISSDQSIIEIEPSKLPEYSKIKEWYKEYLSSKQEL
jgi:replication factor A1